MKRKRKVTKKIIKRPGRRRNPVELQEEVKPEIAIITNGRGKKSSLSSPQGRFTRLGEKDFNIGSGSFDGLLRYGLGMTDITFQELGREPGRPLADRLSEERL